MGKEKSENPKCKGLLHDFSSWPKECKSDALKKAFANVEKSREIRDQLLKTLTEDEKFMGEFIAEKKSSLNKLKLMHDYCHLLKIGPENKNYPEECKFGLLGKLKDNMIDVYTQIYSKRLKSKTVNECHQETSTEEEYNRCMEQGNPAMNTHQVGADFPQKIEPRNARAEETPAEPAPTTMQQQIETLERGEPSAKPGTALPQ